MTFPAGTVRFDELMKAFFIVDRQPGDNHWKFDTWKETKKHDAFALVAKLWSYITMNVVEKFSGLYLNLESFSHFPSVNFNELGKVLFVKACEKDISVKNEWPFNCIDYMFFCGLRDAFNNITRIENKVRSGITEEKKGSAMSALYSDGALRYTNEKADIYYRTSLLSKALKKLLCKNNAKQAFNSIKRERSYAKKRCSSNPNSPLSKFYFCKVKEFINALKRCSELSDPTPCTFHPSIQDYFSGHPNPDSSLVSCMINVTKREIRTIFDAANSTFTESPQKLEKLIASYKPFLTVEDSVCRHDWQKSLCKALKPPCQLQTIYRFDCTMQFIMTPLQKMVNNKPYSEHSKTIAMVWLAYPTASSFHGGAFAVKKINEIILGVQKDASKLVKSYDTSSLRVFSAEIPTAGFIPSSLFSQLCNKETFELRDRIYCYLSPVLDDISLYLDLLDSSKNPNVRTLNPTTNYVTLIGQMQLDRVQSLLTQQIEYYVGDLTEQLQENFASLSNYFSSIAKYDSQKYVADIGYIQGRLDSFKTKLKNTGHMVQIIFQKTLAMALAASISELVGRAAEFATAIAQASNPLAQALGGFDATNLMDRINALAQAGVDMGTIENLRKAELPSLLKMATELCAKFESNNKNLTAAVKLVEKFQNKDKDIISGAEEFLQKYSAYNPQVYLSDITLYGAKWENAAEEVCEAAFAGETALSAITEIELASSGDCRKVKNKVAQLITIYEEMYQYQFDLMDSLSDATRAFLAHEKAVEMQHVYTRGKRVDNAFLSKVAVRSYVISIIHVWKVVIEYCNILTYTNVGQEPDQCKAAINAPSHRAVADVMSLIPPSVCNSNDEHEGYRSIPTKRSSKDDTAFIDLEKLYRGETVTFSIPDLKWLKTNDWISNSSLPRGIFIARFELYLQPMSGNVKHAITIRIQPSIGNYLASRNGTKYLLPLSYFSNTYIEHGGPCYRGSINENPYPEGGSKMCIESNGYIQRDLQPSIFNDWKIRITDVPPKEIVPEHDENFKLQAAITYCLVENTLKQDIPP